RVGVRRGGVQVVVELLGILAVVSLVAGKAVEALLEDRVAAVPQGEREAQPPLAVAPAEEPVLAPAIDAAARVLVREVLPRRPSGGVVLAHGAPLTLAQVRPPPLPVFLAVEVLVETKRFGVGVAHSPPLRSSGGEKDRDRCHSRV